MNVRLGTVQANEAVVQRALMLPILTDLPVNFRLARKYAYVFFAANGFGPWSCFFCGNEVHADWHGIVDWPEALHIHHEDHDDTNHDPKNLVPSHGKCHASYHATLQRETAGGGLAPGLIRENAERDKTPTFCECGAGPFKGPQALKIHRSPKFRSCPL